MKKVLSVTAIICILVIGSHGSVDAQANNTVTSGNVTQNSPGTGAGTANNAGSGSSATRNNPGVSSPTSFDLGLHIDNPLKVATIQDAVKFFVTTIVKIAIPLIVISFIWSGLSFIFAQGRPESVKKAKNIFFNTVIGTLLILGAWTITNAIVGTVNSIAN